MAPSSKSNLFFIDFLRCIAAIAVVAIHVLGPWREQFGIVDENQWLAAVSYNGLLRWAVPVFFMISGALLITHQITAQSPFDCHHYIKRRVVKVLLPFVIWSLIYAMIGGMDTTGWHWEQTRTLLSQANNHPTWYHLWFFYSFIPMYFVIPLLAPVLRQMAEQRIKFLLYAWFALTLLHWLEVDTVLRQPLLLYSGYLVLGWYLINRNNRDDLPLWFWAGGAMLVFNLVGTWQLSHEHGRYAIFFMGYKSFNTAIIAAMVFVLAQAYADMIAGKLRQGISLVARYSFGIYLIHPLFLIPIRNIEAGYYTWFASNWLAIPLLTLIVVLLSLLSSMMLAKLPLLQKLVP
ncbi:acyltransferase [Motilimonas eburnea]|uniref:acyltransferase n=1 Tax=Motilimonas eburnea TaxID=1737488 RepID=UPI001E2A1398|nr:acyltransferase family protein [Motilimonas eburnea]MCE2572418.1 acyltransferase family protein [Motilimonas eburnea]